MNKMNRNRARRTTLGALLVLAVATCGELTGTSAWRCDVTLTMNDQRTATGSGSGSTEQEARDGALAVACAQLGLSGDALGLCEAGRNPGAASWRAEFDCETT